MLDHHIQRTIVYQLALTDAQRFSELKPDYIESKLFTYHLKKVIAAGYVNKDSKGLYQLTPEGRRLGINVSTEDHDVLSRAYSILILIIRRKKDGAWLLYKRKNHPMKDRVGFMHSEPVSNLNVLERATQAVIEKTGLVCGFKVVGSGYSRVFINTLLDGFTHFTALACEDAEGELVENDNYAEYFWEQSPNFSDSRMLPNTKLLAKSCKKGELFFIDETFHL